MFMQLLARECRQTFKSMIYWLIVIIMAVFFFSQLGDTEVAEKPKPDQENYGMTIGGDENTVMEATLGYLVSEYMSGTYATYPIGFYKTVRTDEKEQERIGEIIGETTGLTTKEELENTMKQNSSDGTVVYGGGPVHPAKGITYERFQVLMDEIDDMLGGGSKYGKDNLAKNARTPMTYEQALKEYEDLTEKEHLTGGYARLFCDYMGIILGILPVFLAVTRGMRDRRSQMQELIASRRASSSTIIVSRYVSMLIMLLLPVLLLSCVLLMDCLQTASGSGITVDYFAFVKYSLGWLLPGIMIAAAVGMILTEFTDTGLGILVQSIWWFISIFSSMADMGGGMYGWSLVPRHNTIYGYDLFQKGFAQLAANRILYTVISILLVAVTVWIYSLKRKGRLDIRGKVLGNFKRKHQA